MYLCDPGAPNREAKIYDAHVTPEGVRVSGGRLQADRSKNFDIFIRHATGLYRFEYYAEVWVLKRVNATNGHVSSIYEVIDIKDFESITTFDHHYLEDLLPLLEDNQEYVTHSSDPILAKAIIDEWYELCKK